jgi:hypothetical protein
MGKRVDPLVAELFRVRQSATADAVKRDQKTANAPPQPFTAEQPKGVNH